MAAVGRPKASYGPEKRMEALYSACQCEGKSGVELVQCEVGCLSTPGSDAWRRAEHLAWHKYGLKGKEAFSFAFAFTLGYIEGKES